MRSMPRYDSPVDRFSIRRVGVSEIPVIRNENSQHLGDI